MWHEFILSADAKLIVNTAKFDALEDVIVITSKSY